MDTYQWNSVFKKNNKGVIAGLKHVHVWV